MSGFFSEVHYDLPVESRHEIIIDKDKWYDVCSPYNMRICNIERPIGEHVMIPVPPDIIARFQDFLDRKPVQKRFQAYYKKWLRFYWDFCQKYHHPVSKHENLSHFIEKRHQKKQKDYQIEQALDAVSLYYEIVKERPSIAEHVTIRKNTSVKKAEIFPYNDTTVFCRARRETFKCCSSRACGRPALSDGLSGFRDQKFAGDDIKNYLSRGGSKTFRIF